MNPNNPLIIQSNHTLLLEVDNPLFPEARDAICAFAHLEKSPEYIHTYLITPLSLWNAAALGIKPEQVGEALERFSKYPVPPNVVVDVIELMGRFGKLVLVSEEGRLVLRSEEPQLLAQLARHPAVSSFLGDRHDNSAFLVPAAYRGVLKQALISVGYPAHDLAGYVEGEPLPIAMAEAMGSGTPFSVRPYQRMAAESFIGNASMPGGSGVVVLPCGAGKTVVGMQVMALLSRRTLILATNVTAARQWRREILDKTSLTEEELGEYSGERKEIKPVTIATYQILTYRRSKTADFEHFEIFNRENWGLVIYDEVHLLPAPVFKFTANVQARRRLGLTATLVREDGHEEDVFALIGPKKFDVPWKDLEAQGWIAKAHCVEIRVNLPQSEKMQYLSLAPKRQIRLAYENPNKIPLVRELIEKHPKDRILIIGQYLTQLNEFASEFDAPIITGSTPNQKREVLYEQFRSGKIHVLVLSKVGNFAVDLPDANIAIQISGSFGSRQEEAQRLGRILRPKSGGEQALFYSIVTRESRELDFAMKRQLFLAEQGYAYQIEYRDYN